MTYPVHFPWWYDQCNKLSIVLSSTGKRVWWEIGQFIFYAVEGWLLVVACSDAELCGKFSAALGVSREILVACTVWSVGPGDLWGAFNKDDLSDCELSSSGESRQWWI